MRESILNVVVLRAVLERLDLAEVANVTITLAEDYMPGCSWLDERGEVHYAETMSEVDGLALCQVQEPDEDDELDDCFWVARWVREVGLEEVADRLESELILALTTLR